MTLRRSMVLSATFGLALVALAAAADSRSGTTPVKSTGDMDPKDFPCWRGALGNGTTADSGTELIDDMSKAKVLWKSEDRAMSIGYGPYNLAKNEPHAYFRSGYASPVVAGGRVYLFYMVPHGWNPPPGKDITPELAALGKEMNGKSKNGDDIVLCADADTGKTVWRRVFAEQGINHGGSSKYGTHVTPCVANGKIYILGSVGRIYCLDAKTGTTVWTNNVGKAFDVYEAVRKGTGPEPGGRYDLSSCPTYADGVAIFNDHSGSLLGLDGETGKELWRTPGVCGEVTSPTRWPYKGKTYVIVHGKCVDPKTGKVLWTAPQGLHLGTVGSFAVSGDTMVTTGGHIDLSGGKDKKVTIGIMAFRISDKGATELWRQTDGSLNSMHSSPVIYNGYVYADLIGAPGAQEGRVGCFDLTTGKIVRIYDKMGRTANDASPVAGDGRVIFRSSGSGGGGYVMFSEGGKGFERMGGISPAVAWESSISATYARGRLYFRGANSLWCLDMKKEKP